ncbi:MAG: hypothetical protein IPQ05_15440 [Leptospiraceae bacterium]|nr:hypothetical protein [Leptospiraceae bacterium]
MIKLIKIFLENITRAVDYIASLNWNERNITVNWNYGIETNKGGVASTSQYVVVHRLGRSFFRNSNPPCPPLKKGVSELCVFLQVCTA